MKIGILTHHYINNFGAFLQAYSLQKAVEELCPDDEVYIIDYVNRKHFVINVGGWFRFYREKENFLNWIQKIKVPFTFAKARKKYMNLTKICYDARNIEKLNLDYIIIGSDEVWNYKETKGNAKVKFGVGLEKEELVAYAPSVGQTIDMNVPEYVKNGILKFKAVSARDLLTEELIKKIRKENVYRVLDPTFLIKVPTEPVENVKKPYILFYYCDGLDFKEKEKIFKYAYKNGMNVYGAGECDKNYTDITVNLTPFQWVWMFTNANYVVTGTFHGAVFSILNRRQFACYLTNKSRIEKVGSLLKEFGLEKKQTNGQALDIIDKMQESIDYNKIENAIKIKYLKSKKFLKDNIN